ncbi:MAG: hypothetical protein H7248_03360 [Microbacteriaceae bacterium]|nr:hypothetical protein [Microbacteriaceae bacterium]
MIKEAPPTATRIERVLAYMLASVIGLSILSFFAIVLGTLFGMTGPDFAGGAWPAVAVLPYYGLPFGVALIITLVVVSARRRAAEARSHAAAAEAPRSTKRPKSRGVAEAKAASSAAQSGSADTPGNANSGTGKTSNASTNTSNATPQSPRTN